jgi:hypothetical protein
MGGDFEIGDIVFGHGSVSAIVNDTNLYPQGRVVSYRYTGSKYYLDIVVLGSGWSTAFTKVGRVSDTPTIIANLDAVTTPDQRVSGIDIVDLHYSAEPSTYHVNSTNLTNDTYELIDSSTHLDRTPFLEGRAVGKVGGEDKAFVPTSHSSLKGDLLYYNGEYVVPDGTSLKWERSESNTFIASDTDTIDMKSNYQPRSTLHLRNAETQKNTYLQSTFGDITNDRVSPVIDVSTLYLGLISNRIDNEKAPSYDSTGNALIGARSSYVSKRIKLDEPANSVKVIFDGLLPKGSSFDVYAKTSASEIDDFADQNYYELTSENKITNSDGEFREFVYSKDDFILDFSTLSVKIVFRSTDSLRVPRIKNFKVIPNKLSIADNLLESYVLEQQQITNVTNTAYNTTTNDMIAIDVPFVVETGNVFVDQKKGQVAAITLASVAEGTGYTINTGYSIPAVQAWGVTTVANDHQRKMQGSGLHVFLTGVNEAGNIISMIVDKDSPGSGYSVGDYMVADNHTVLYSGTGAEFSVSSLIENEAEIYKDAYGKIVPYDSVKNTGCYVRGKAPQYDNAVDNVLAQTITVDIQVYGRKI